MTGLQDFWSLVVDVWNSGVFGVDLGRIITAIAILAGFMILRRFFAAFVIARLKRWAAKSDNKLDDAVLDALERPLAFIPIVLGIFFSSEYLHLTSSFDVIAQKLVRSLVVVVIFWALFNAAKPLSGYLTRLETVFSRPMMDWFIKALRGAIVFLGAAAVLEIWGIEIGPILAGLGLFGVAVALGAQDLFKNLIAGILVLAERRFEPGDWIRVDDVVEGTVEDIGFRSTLVRRFDLAPVHVPNSQLSDGAVTNFSRMTHRRIYWVIGVEYRSTVAQLRQIRDQIEAYITENDVFMPAGEASTFVRIDAFGDSSIDIMLYCFTRTTNWGDWLEIKETLAYRIKDIVERAGSGFAFPSRSLYVETLPGETPEIFEPPTEAADPVAPADREAS